MKVTSKDSTLLLHHVASIENKVRKQLIEESLKEELKSRVTQLFEGAYFKLVLSYFPKIEQDLFESILSLSIQQKIGVAN